jgi:hypothetical protein
MPAQAPPAIPDRAVFRSEIREFAHTGTIDRHWGRLLHLVRPSVSTERGCQLTVIFLATRYESGEERRRTHRCLDNNTQRQFVPDPRERGEIRCSTRCSITWPVSLGSRGKRQTKEKERFGNLGLGLLGDGPPTVGTGLCDVSGHAAADLHNVFLVSLSASLSLELSQ